jgi:hypothetical protein
MTLKNNWIITINSTTITNIIIMASRGNGK